MNKIYTDADGNKIERISRWIKIRNLAGITPRHSLYDYATDGCGYHPYQDKFDPSTGIYLDCFTTKGTTYALEQFLSTTSSWAGAWHPFYSENDVDDYVIISGYDMNNCFNPLLIELDECCEHIRIYREVK